MVQLGLADGAVPVRQLNGDAEVGELGGLGLLFQVTPHLVRVQQAEYLVALFDVELELHFWIR